MNRTTITPHDEKNWLELRTHDLTSTDIAALFNISPYMTRFELWHRKKNKTVVELEPSEVMKWGNRLQNAIAEGIALDNGWRIRRMNEYMRIPELRIGASFDYSIEEFKDGDISTDGYVVVGGLKTGILEIKNVFGLIFKDQWLEDEEGNVEAPPHIEIQVQQQLLVSGRAFAYIGALVSGNKVVLLKREPNEKIFEAIKTKSAEFWKSIDNVFEPKPDFEEDAEFIGTLMNYAEPNTVIDLRSDAETKALCEQYREFSQQMKEAEQKRDALKAQLLLKVGDAEKVLGDGFSITSGMVAPTHVEYDRKGYRMFKVNWPREKK